MKLDFEDLIMTWDSKTLPMRVPPDYNPTSKLPSPVGMELYLAAFQDHLFDNDETHFVSNTPMPQDDSSHTTPSDSFTNPNLTVASNKHKAVYINDWVESKFQHLDASKRRRRPCRCLDQIPFLVG